MHFEIVPFPHNLASMDNSKVSSHCLHVVYDANKLQLIIDFTHSVTPPVVFKVYPKLQVLQV